jgi:hypothetical protein
MGRLTHLQTVAGVAIIGGMRITISLLPFCGLAVAASLSGEINGRWCDASGRSFTIDGEQIMTPGGQHATGRFSSNAFVHEGPREQPPFDKKAAMIVTGDDEIGITGAPMWTVDFWHRCTDAIM